MSIFGWLFKAPSVEKLEEKGDIKGLIKALAHKDWKIRHKAELALEGIGDQAVTPLIKALKNNNNSVRLGAAKTLGEVGDQRAIDPLIGALGDSDEQVRWRAASALELIGKPVVEPLLQGLNHKDMDMRWRAALVIERIGYLALDPLGVAAKHKKKVIRSKAEELLERIERSIVEADGIVEEQYPEVAEPAAVLAGLDIEDVAGEKKEVRAMAESEVAVTGEEAGPSTEPGDIEGPAVPVGAQESTSGDTEEGLGEEIRTSVSSEELRQQVTAPEPGDVVEEPDSRHEQGMETMSAPVMPGEVEEGRDVSDGDDTQAGNELKQDAHIEDQVSEIDSAKTNGIDKSLEKDVAEDLQLDSDEDVSGEKSEGEDRRLE